MQILIAVDGSEHSLVAARAGLSLTHPDAAITILEVVTPVEGAVEFASGLEGPVAFAVDEEVDAANLARGVAQAGELAEHLGRVATVRVEEGDPGSVICQVAEEMDADLVIVGSHGKGFVRRMVLGSVSTYVTHHAPCPVMVVRTDQVEADDAESSID